jgi:hypothetical protein
MVEYETILQIGIPIITLGIGYGMKALRDSGKLPGIQTKMDDVAILVECINDTVKSFNEAMKDGEVDGNEVDIIIGKLNVLGKAIAKLVL